MGRKKIDKRISNSDIIFICTPVSLVDEILREIIPFVSKKNLITDTGSVKNIFETQLDMEPKFPLLNFKLYDVERLIISNKQ